MIGVGFHYLDDSDTAPAPPVAAFLDVAGAECGMRSPERLVRIYFQGRPDPAEVAAKAAEWHGRGCRVQLGNEPNLEAERFGGGPDDYAGWFLSVADLAPPDARLYYAGISPGVPGWQDWYSSALAQRALERAHGLVVHAYGTLDQMKETIGFFCARFPGKPLWLAEFNFGAGLSVDREAWGRSTIGPLMDWLHALPQVEAATFFAYRWPHPDMRLPTPVDAVGTEIERQLRAWQPPHLGRTDVPTNPWTGKIAIVWNLPPNLDGMIALGRDLGLAGFDLKVADGNSSWVGRRVTRAQCDALHAAGFRVLGWSYNYCDGKRNAGDRGDGVPEEEAAAALQAINLLGLDGWSSDLEIECEGCHPAVVTMLDSVRRGTTLPVAAYTWADLKGHDRYPAAEIAQRVDVIRPMVYRPVWTAGVCWPCWTPFGKPICPAWGVTEAAIDDLRTDIAFADGHGIQGESYWELQSLTTRAAQLRPLLAGRFGTAPSTGPTTADMDANAWGPALRAAQYLRDTVGTPTARHVADIVGQAIQIHKESVGAA